MANLTPSPRRSNEGKSKDNNNSRTTINGHSSEVTTDLNTQKMQRNKKISARKADHLTPHMRAAIPNKPASTEVISQYHSELLSDSNRSDHDSEFVNYKNATNKSTVQTDRSVHLNNENFFSTKEHTTRRQSMTNIGSNIYSAKEYISSNHPAFWGHWGPCSVTCGTGAQERSRECGPNCQEVESRECYLNSCHGIMSGTEFSDLNHESQWTPSSGNRSRMEDQSLLDTDIDACTMWSTCKDEYLQRYTSQLTDLPNCPCYLPFNLLRDNNVWDDASQRFFHWVEVNSTEEKLSVYKPGAYKCVRSLLFPGASTLASQICCYSFNLKLITRGRNAGTVNLISPQISWELHYKIDILPWVICKGDWTRYNRVLSPNNMLGCQENPNEEILLEEIKDALDY